MKLIINNKTLFISPKTLFNYNRSSPLFYPLEGERVLPFTLPNVAVNREVLGFPHLPSSGAGRKASWPCSGWLGSFLLFEGNLKVNTADSEEFVCDITITPGFIPKTLWQRNLTDLDLGGETIPTIPKQSQYIWEMNISDVEFEAISLGMNLVTYNNITVSIFTDNEEVSKYFYVNSDHAPANFNLDYLLNQVFPVLNNSLGNDDYLTNSNSKIFIFTKNRTVGSVRLSVMFSDHNNNLGGLKIYNFHKSSYDTIQQDYYDDKIDNTVYALPEISDFKFYTNTKLGFSGVINKKIARKIQLNQDGFLNRNTIVPCIKLTWLLEKIAQLTGFKIKGTFFQDPELVKLLIFNIFSTDKTGIDPLFPFNTHASEIKYANHLPKIKISEFFQFLSDQFALGIEFNSSLKTIEIFTARQVIESLDVVDISKNIYYKPTLKQRDQKPLQLKYDLAGDELAKEDGNEIFHPFPDKSIVDSSDSEYEKKELKFPSLVVSTINGVRQIPEAGMQGISPIGSQTGENPKRLVFWENGRAENKTDRLYLSLTGEHSIYERYQKSLIEFLENMVPYETMGLFTAGELLSLTSKSRVHAYGVHFLVDKISADLVEGQQVYKVKLDLLRC